MAAKDVEEGTDLEDKRIQQEAVTEEGRNTKEVDDSNTVGGDEHVLHHHRRMILPDNNTPDQQHLPPMFTLQHASDLQDIILHYSSQHEAALLIVVVAYQPSCPQSMQFLWNFQYAVRQAFDGNNAIDTTILQELDPIIVVQVPVQESTASILEQFAVTHVPALFFLKEQGEIPWNDPSVVGEKGDSGGKEGEEEIDLDASGEAESDDNSQQHQTPMVPLLYATKYMGAQQTIDDLVHGMYHYLTRIRFATQSYQINTYRAEDEYLDSMTMRVQSLQQLQDMMLVYKDKLLRHVPIPIDPNHSEEEIAWIRYLLDDTPATTTNEWEKEDPFYAICQCRSQDDQPEEEYEAVESPMIRRWYREFDQVASVMAIRRDTVLCVMLSCEDDDDGSMTDDESDGDIVVYTIRPNQEWKLGLKAVFHPNRIDLTPPKSEDEEEEHDYEFDDEPRSSIRARGTGILDFVTELLRPTVMWLERRTTGSIAFHHQYHRHAVLFVDFHHDTDENRLEMRDAVRIFREECEARRFHLDNPNHIEEAPMVCLVVPSTDTRVLTTFGVDIWSPLDFELSEQVRCMFDALENNETDIDDPQCQSYNNGKPENREDGKPFQFSKLLPVVLVTNQRSDGTGIERFYLDPPVSTTSLATFFDSIFEGTAKRAVQSTSLENTNARIRNGHEFPSNKYGVFVLNGESLPGFVEDYKDQHVLLNLNSPTCGHSKRFSIIWNELAELMGYIQWDDRVVMGKMDATVNECFIKGLVADWFPALFYFRPGVTENPIDYENTQMAREMELGGISNALDLVDWWMDEAGDSIDEMELLNSLGDDEEGITLSRNATGKV